MIDRFAIAARVNMLVICIFSALADCAVDGNSSTNCSTGTVVSDFYARWIGLWIATAHE